MAPSTILVAQLAAARRRGEGFDTAWPAALGVALAAAKVERSEWAAVLGSMVGVFREAFEQRPAQAPELAIRTVAEDREAVAA